MVPTAGPWRGRLQRRARWARGFTMVELAATLVIVGVLASLSIAYYRQQVLRAKAVATVEKMTIIRIALTLFEADCGALPAPAARGGDPGLCYVPSGLADRWNGPYLDAWPQTTPLGGSVAYTAGESSSEDPARLSVDGLPSAEADALSSAARSAFGDGVSSQQTGPPVAPRYSVGSPVGDPLRAPAATRPARQLSGGYRAR